MSISDKRREEQLEFLKSGKDLIYGDKDSLPASIEFLQNISDTDPAVKSSHTGLTAFVFCVEIEGELWNVKKKRDVILVKNTDGQVSFLNEIQRRITLEEFRKRSQPLEPSSNLLSGIVATVYADLNAGLIVSRWIKGDHVKLFTREIFNSLFDTLFMMDRTGIMEYDLCSGNLLLTSEGQIKLFDFGYAYPYDPIKYLNPDGMGYPIFHPVERFESRFFMQYLLDLGNEKGENIALELYRVEKEEAVVYYQRKLEWLRESNAAEEVISWVSGYLNSWNEGLVSAKSLESLYALESFRSYVLDLDDDLRGQSCTLATLQKAERILEIIESRYDFLVQKKALFWGDELLDKQALLAKYRKNRESAKGYQL